MNQVLALKGKKINKIEHVGPPLSYDEIDRREAGIEQIKTQALSYSLGVPLDVVNAVCSLTMK